jgi:hypothetical protein
MANVIIDKANLSDPVPEVVKVGGVCYKKLEENDKTPTTIPPIEEMSSCDCCDAVSVEYSECDTPANKIYVNPAVISLNPPPATVEIANVCYENPVCSQTAVDVASIDSTPVDCDAPACNPVVPIPCDFTFCGAVCGGPSPATLTVSGLQGIPDGCPGFLPPPCIIAGGSVVMNLVNGCGGGLGYISSGLDPCVPGFNINANLAFDPVFGCLVLSVFIGAIIWVGHKDGSTWTGVYTACTDLSSPVCAYSIATSLTVS